MHDREREEAVEDLPVDEGSAEKVKGGNDHEAPPVDVNLLGVKANTRGAPRSIRGVDGS